MSSKAREKGPGFTKGKWSVKTVLWHDAKIHFIVAGKKTIAEVCNSPESNQDAQLIAAAPDMHGLLVEILEICKTCEQVAGLPLDEAEAFWDGLESKVNEVLRKAEGR